MASHALKQVRRPIYPTFDCVVTSNLFFTGDFTHHRPTGANECTTFHAQSQRAR